MTANATARLQPAKLSGRHYITFQVSNHTTFSKPNRKTRRFIFPPTPISAELGNAG
jgi:hypothetical protein